MKERSKQQESVATYQLRCSLLGRCLISAQIGERTISMLCTFFISHTSQASHRARESVAEGAIKWIVN